MMEKYKVEFVSYSRQTAIVEVYAKCTEEAKDIAEMKGEREGFNWKPDVHYWEESIVKVEKEE